MRVFKVPLRLARLVGTFIIFSALLLPQGAFAQPAGIDLQLEKLLPASAACLAAQQLGILNYSIELRRTG